MRWSASTASGKVWVIILCFQSHGRGSHENRRFCTPGRVRIESRNSLLCLPRRIRKARDSRVKYLLSAGSCVVAASKLVHRGGSRPHSRLCAGARCAHWWLAVDRHQNRREPCLGRDDRAQWSKPPRSFVDCGSGSTLARDFIDFELLQVAINCVVNSGVDIWFGLLRWRGN